MSNDQHPMTAPGRIFLGYCTLTSVGIMAAVWPSCWWLLPAGLAIFGIVHAARKLP